MSLRVYDTAPGEVQAMVEQQVGIDLEFAFDLQRARQEGRLRFASKRVPFGAGVTVFAGYDPVKACCYVEWFDDCRKQRFHCLDRRSLD